MMWQVEISIEDQSKYQFDCLRRIHLSNSSSIGHWLHYKPRNTGRQDCIFLKDLHKIYQHKAHIWNLLDERSHSFQLKLELGIIHWQVENLLGTHYMKQ